MIKDSHKTFEISNEAPRHNDLLTDWKEGFAHATNGDRAAASENMQRNGLLPALAVTDLSNPSEKGSGDNSKHQSGPTAKHPIVMDASGDVTALRQQNGDVWQFGYTDGKVSSVTQPNGAMLEVGADGNLHEIDQSGNLTGAQLKERIIPDANGSISFYNNDGGNTSVLKNDGSVVDVDSNGRISSTRTPSGELTTFKYNKDNTLAEVDTPSAQYKRNPFFGGVTEYVSGKQVGTFSDVRIGADGSYELRNDNGKDTVVNPDGSRYATTDQLDYLYPSPPIIVKRAGSSDLFAMNVAYEASTLPPQEQQAIRNGGFQYVAAGTISDGLKTSNPESYDSVAGITSDDPKEIVIPERSSNGMNDFHLNPDPQGVIRHESGHALDFSTNNPSQQSAFINSYNEELAKLPPDERKQFDGIFIEGESNGDATPQTRREVYAEMIATLTGGNGMPNDQLLRQYFPNTLALVNNQLLNPEQTSLLGLRS